MSELKVQAFSVSIDGFGAGRDQSLAEPLGGGGRSLHEWFFPTRTCRQMTGATGDTSDLDDPFAKRSFVNIGAWTPGRHMFGPIRGA